MKLIFGSDIDDTLTDTFGFIKRLIWEKFGIDVSREKFTSYYYRGLLKRLGNKRRKELFDSFRLSECVRLAPLKEAIQSLKILKENGYYIVLVTARDISASLKTTEWLIQKKELPSDKLIFAHKKWEIDIPFNFFAEDDGYQAMKLADKGVKVF